MVDSVAELALFLSIFALLLGIYLNTRRQAKILESILTKLESK